MKRKYITLLSLLLAVVMVAVFMPQTTFAQSGRVGAGDVRPVQPPEKTEEPYMMQDFCELAKMNAIVLAGGMNETAVIGESHGYGTLIKGPVSELENGRVKIVSRFDFTEGPVGRISLHGVSERGVHAEVLVYLDDDENPVCSFGLDNKGPKDGWKVGEMITKNVYNKGISGTHEVSFGFRITGKDDAEKTSILLRKIEFCEDPGIPTMYFNIDEGETTIDDMNSSKDHSVSCYGDVDIKVPAGYISEYQQDSGASPMGDKSADVEIRGRGNSTWNADKKPYKIKLTKKDAEDEGVDLFGMGKSKHWVLLANRFDNSLMRNRMTYWLGDKMGMEFTPQCVPVDVVMNGEYYGSYLLCEQVRIGKSRVNIDELDEEVTVLPDLSGGYLLAMAPYSTEDKRSIFQTERGVDFINNDPDFVDYDSKDQKDYIRGYIQDTEDAVFGDGFVNADGKSWKDFMDLDAAAGYWWVQELSRNGDAYCTHSTYLYKKRNDKLFWGPLWDFDYVAWGNLEDKNDPYVNGFNNTKMKWFDHLLGDTDFTDALTDRWGDIGSSENENNLLGQIVKKGGILDKYYDELKISQRYDHEKYGYFSEDYHEDSDQEETEDQNHPYIDEVNQLRNWVSGRQDWVNENIESLNDQTNTITFVADGNVVEKLIVQDRLAKKEIPDAPEKEGHIFEGWYTKPEGGKKLVFEEDEVTDESYINVDADMTYYAHYVKEEGASVAKDLFFRDRVCWAEINVKTYTPLFAVVPNNAIDKRIRWTSSDNKIATVDNKGKVTLLNVGKVTITGTLTSGASASYELNVIDPEATVIKAPEDIEVEDDEVTLEMGSYGYNPYKLLPAGEPVRGGPVYYESEDEDIVIWGACGDLYAVGPGTAKVKVSDYVNELETTFTVTVTGEEDEEPPIDAIDNAINVLMQMNKYVKKADYTKASYDAYYKAYMNALTKLKEGDLTAEEVSELRHSVIMAQLDLVKKKANTLKVKAKNVKVRHSKLKKRAVMIKRSKALVVRKAKGKVTYARVAKGSSKRLSISKRTGKIKVKKKTRKGLYKIKVKVKAAGDGNYRPASKTVTVKVKVR